MRNQDVEGIMKLQDCYVQTVAINLYTRKLEAWTKMLVQNGLAPELKAAGNLIKKKSYFADPHTQHQSEHHFLVFYIITSRT